MSLYIMCMYIIYGMHTVYIYVCFIYIVYIHIMYVYRLCKNNIFYVQIQVIYYVYELFVYK